METRKDLLKVESLDFDDEEEMLRFDEAWIAASLETTRLELAEMVRAGIIDSEGKRISTFMPPDMLNPEASVDQQ